MQNILYVNRLYQIYFDGGESVESNHLYLTLSTKNKDFASTESINSDMKN